MMLMLLQVFDNRGLPFSYLPRTDDFIALILLVCFFFTAFMLSRTKKNLLLQMKGLFSTRERISIFAANTNIDIRFLLLMLLQTCIFGGLFIFNFFNDISPILMELVSPTLLIGVYTASCILYLLFKWLLYLLLGWVFFDKIKTNLWIQSYFTLVYSFGFVLFPFVLLLIYFDLEMVYLVIFGLILLFFVTFFQVLPLFKKAFCPFKFV